MFPVSNSSQTIIDCFLTEVKKYGIDVLTNQSVQSIFRAENYWKIETNADNFACQKLILSTGSNPKIWEMLSQMNHNVIDAVPSLFTFNITDKRIKDLMGLSAFANVRVKNSKLEAFGPLLITHWGMSGPGILKLSAWGAIELAAKKYQFAIEVNWLNDLDFEDAIEALKELKQEHAKKTVCKKAMFELPSRLWENLVAAAAINADAKWADLNKNDLVSLAQQLTKGEFQVHEKSTFKEEFVTAGGVDLKEINFKTMESKLHKDLFFAGEIVNVDAITGGFNFQNAWTSGFLVANNFTD